jgi:hypothetical protein
MSSTALKMFQKDGWSINSESPLTISNGKSSATGWAAEIVMSHYEDRSQGKHEILRPLRKSA